MNTLSAREPVRDRVVPWSGRLAMWLATSGLWLLAAGCSGLGNAAEQLPAIAQAEPAGVEVAESTVSPGATAEAAAEATPAAPDPPPVQGATILLQAGDTPPGGGGLPVSDLGVPVVDGEGRVAFTGVLDDGADGDPFVWRDGQIIWRSSQTDPPRIRNITDLMGHSDQGEFIIQGFTASSDVLWTQLGVFLTKGDPAPGIDHAVIQLSRQPTMTPDGRAHWVSEFRDGKGAKGRGQVFYRSDGADPDSIEVLLRSDQLIDGSPISRPTGIETNYQVSKDGDRSILLLDLDTGSNDDNRVVLVDGKVAHRKGEPAPALGIWERFRQVAINNHGDYLFSAEIDGPPAEQDVVIVHNGRVGLREGQRIDGITLSAQAEVLSLAIDERGRAAHMWSVGGFGNEYIFFACDASRLEDSTLLMIAGADHRSQGVARFRGIGFGPTLWLSPAKETLDVFVGLGRQANVATDAILSIDLPACAEADPGEPTDS